LSTYNIVKWTATSPTWGATYPSMSENLRTTRTNSWVRLNIVGHVVWHVIIGFSINTHLVQFNRTYNKKSNYLCNFISLLFCLYLYAFLSLL